MTETNKLDIKHIQHYPIGGENALTVTNGSEVKKVDGIYTFDNKTEFWFKSGGWNLHCESWKPIVRPMSYLYKEINGEVGIVEIAKILSGTVLVDKIEGCCRNLSYFRCTFEDYGCEELIINEKCEGWYRSYFDKNQPNTGRNVIDQAKVFDYLDSRHYDWRYNLIEQGLADIKTI